MCDIFLGLLGDFRLEWLISIVRHTVELRLAGGNKHADSSRLQFNPAEMVHILHVKQFRAHRSPSYYQLSPA
jgi:hypothetical protein